MIYVLIICVLFNHLGMAKLLTFNTKYNVILNCPKCLTFWSTLTYFIVFKEHDVLYTLSFAFINAFFSVLLKTFLDYVDYLIDKIYDKICSEDTQANKE